MYQFMNSGYGDSMAKSDSLLSFKKRKQIAFCTNGKMMDVEKESSQIKLGKMNSGF